MEAPCALGFAITICNDVWRPWRMRSGIVLTAIEARSTSVEIAVLVIVIRPSSNRRTIAASAGCTLPVGRIRM